MNSGNYAQNLAELSIKADPTSMHISVLPDEDGSIHVAELDINGAIFHIHETMRDALEPIGAKGVTAVIGLFVPDVDAVMKKAIQAGATEINPVTDHDYGYRQGMFQDPFGHYWQIQKKI